MAEDKLTSMKHRALLKSLKSMTLMCIIPIASSQAFEENLPTQKFNNSSVSWELFHFGSLVEQSEEPKEYMGFLGTAFYFDMGSREEFLWLDQMKFQLGSSIDYIFQGDSVKGVAGTPALRFLFHTVDSRFATAIGVGYFMAKAQQMEFLHGPALTVQFLLHLRRAWYLSLNVQRNFGIDLGASYALGWQKQF